MLGEKNLRSEEIIIVKVIDPEYKERVKKNIHLSKLKASIKFAEYLLKNHIDLLWFEEHDYIIEEYLKILNTFKQIKEAK